MGVNEANPGGFEMNTDVGDPASVGTQGWWAQQARPTDVELPDTPVRSAFVIYYFGSPVDRAVPLRILEGKQTHLYANK